MTLDLVSVSSQLQEMGSNLSARRSERMDQLDRARAAFNQLSDDWERLAEIARGSDRSAAAPLGPLDTVVDGGTSPPSYEVLATDGSSIEPDRHGPAMCALINIGRVRIRYGDMPEAELDNQPRLYHLPDELYVEQSGRRLLLRERLLDARRSLREMEALRDMGERVDGWQGPRVALADGLLTIWRDDWASTKEGTDFVKQFSNALKGIADEALPIAAYISSPSSHWVVDMLRGVADCGVQCRFGCPDVCAFRGPIDIDLFRHLQPGQRSGLYEMVGKDQIIYDEAVRSHFFYLNVGSEIVRIEVPAWVAWDEEALGLVHSVLMDQVDRGQGYPAALARAHEQAVLSGRDRVTFQRLVVEALIRSGLSAEISEKQASKNLRAV